MTPITYGRIDAVLRSLGFTLRIEDEARIYEHEPTGALIAIAYFPDTTEVLPRHLVAVRSILEAYGITDPLELDSRLQRAS
jgi:hypothetical protein